MIWFRTMSKVPEPKPERFSFANQTINYHYRQRTSIVKRRFTDSHNEKTQWKRSSSSFHKSGFSAQSTCWVIAFRLKKKGKKWNEDDNRTKEENIWSTGFWKYMALVANVNEFKFTVEIFSLKWKFVDGFQLTFRMETETRLVKKSFKIIARLLTFRINDSLWFFSFSCNKRNWH